MDGLFALGSNGSGQLGLGHREDVSVPKQVQFTREAPKDDMITRVAAGGNHTILLTESGRAYWSGDSSTNSCGIVSDSEQDSAQFQELVISKSDSSPSRVAHVACTWDSSVLILEDAHGKATQVYICGITENKVVRPGTDVASKGEPNLLVDFPPPGREVKDVAAGFKHVVIVLDNGDVYGWGNGRKGQLGRVDEGNDLIYQHPRQINDVNFKVAKAVCCQYTTCLIAEPGDGRILVLGADKWGLQSKAPIEVPSWKMISASWGGIYILKRDGSLIAWGRDDHGQLPPPNVPAISSIAAGSEHVLALTENGDVLAWGWGEHGNCGPQTEKFGDVKGRWNVLASLKNLPEGTQITTIGAGCATSWIYIVADGIFL
ncbi:regulator of chromosome condensation 1/beta-lactamase-inhibitor protein II [Biscogniauxia mediterranea]|nr:regulator of chromosome condensation 1/beta-lactamase-inhibitor protein II [Biscogniauxia mediterranea]